MEDIIVLTANYYPKKAGEMFAKQTDSRFFHLPAHVGEENIRSYIDLIDYLVAKITK